MTTSRLRFRVELEQPENVYIRDVVSRHRTLAAAEKAAARAMQKRLDQGAGETVTYIADIEDEAHPYRWVWPRGNPAPHRS